MLKKTLFATVALPFLLTGAYGQETVPVDDMEQVETDTTMDTDTTTTMDTDATTTMDTDTTMDAEPMDTDTTMDADTAVDAPADAAPMNSVIVTDQQSSEVRGDWIMGSTVNSPQGEVIGRVEDLILDSEVGTVSAAVISVGGFLGIGSKQIAVDWNELQIQYDGQEIVLAMTRDEADAAPEYAFRDRTDPPAPAGGMGATDPAAPVVPQD